MLEVNPRQPVAQVVTNTHKLNKIEQFNYSKRKVLRIFQNIGLLILLIIIERIFQTLQTDFENQLIPKAQSFFNLIDINQKRYKDIYSLDVLSMVDSGPVFVMICTNIFITIYVGIDALVALKIMYTTFYGYIFLIILQLIYTNPRPFWKKNNIFAPKCLQSFSNPSTSCGIFLFIIFYTYHSFKIKSNNQSNYIHSKKNRKNIILLTKIVLFIAFLAFSFTQFITGEQYIVTMCLGLIYGRLYYKIIVLFESQLTNFIKHMSIMNIDSKKYVFYSVAIMILFELLIVIILDNENPYLYFEWVENFMQCMKENNEPTQRIPYTLLVGPQFTFQKSSIFAAYIGALFGVAHCFRYIKTLEWYRGPMKKKIISKRIFIANLLTLPSWIFQIQLQEISLNPFINQIGMSLFALECVHLFCLYVFLFGFMPLKLFKFLKLNASGSSAYNVLEAEDQ